MPRHCRSDEEIVLVALSNEGGAIKYVAPSLLSSKAFVLLALNACRDGVVFQHLCGALLPPHNHTSLATVPCRVPHPLVAMPL